MERRRLGRTEMDASILGFGGSEIGYERARLPAVERLLGRALDAGLNVIDTAECYEESEALIGRALGSRRGAVYLFTKCGHAEGGGRADWRPSALLASIERSLARLRTDHVDLDPAPQPVHRRAPTGGRHRGPRARARQGLGTVHRVQRGR